MSSAMDGNETSGSLRYRALDLLRRHQVIAEQVEPAVRAQADEYLVDALTDVLRDERLPARGSGVDGPTLVRLNALLAEPADARPWVVHEMLPSGGLSVVAAKPKLGKSTDLRNLVLAVSRGEPFLGRATTAGAAVYLAFEDHRERVAQHFRSMGAHDEPIVIGVGPVPGDPVTFLSDVIAREHPALVAVDPWAPLLGVRDLNDYAQVTAALTPLLQLARLTGVHIIGAHHIGKVDREGGDALLGSTALFGAVDTALLMRRDEGGARVIESVQRYGVDLSPIVVGFEPETGLIFVRGAREDVTLADVSQRVLNALSDRSLDETAIRAAVSHRLTPKALRSLVEKDRIERHGAGKKGDPFLYRRNARIVVPERQRTSSFENARILGRAPLGKGALSTTAETNQNDNRSGGSVSSLPLVDFAQTGYIDALAAEGPPSDDEVAL